MDTPPTQGSFLRNLKLKEGKGANQRGELVSQKGISYPSNTCQTPCQEETEAQQRWVNEGGGTSP